MSFKRWMVFSMLSSVAIFAQEPEGGGGDAGDNGFHFQGPYDGSTYSQFFMPAGVTYIDGKSYISLRLQPEIVLGKFGMGLDVPLLFNTNDGKLRTDEYKDGVGVLRVIRYLRYGIKHQDPFYARVGDLTGTYLGQGLIMYNYTNAVSFEKRKIGANVDVNFDKKYGLEAVYSDFDGFNIFGMRPYWRPLRESGTPLLKNLEVGVTYITDQDKRTTVRGMSEWGVDVSVPVVNNSFLQIVPYIEFAKMLKNDDLNDSAKAATLDYKSGQALALGTNFRFNLVADVFQLGVKLERRLYSDNFVPQYYDAVYEINKDQKAYAVLTAKSVQGNYGEIYGNLIGKVQLLGSIEIPDKLKKSDGAYIHLGASAPSLIPKITLSATYDKGYLDDLKDAFKLDQRSVADVIVAYQAYTAGPFVVNAGVDYKWTFVEKSGGRLKAVKYITPFVGLTTSLPIGDQKK